MFKVGEYWILKYGEKVRLIIKVLKVYSESTLVVVKVMHGIDKDHDYTGKVVELHIPVSCIAKKITYDEMILELLG
jgi:hypothetical protein